MRTLILTALLMIAFNTDGGEPPQIQHTDPTKPFYVPPPPPDPVDDQGPEAFELQTWEDYLAHPNAQYFHASASYELRERVLADRHQRLAKAEEKQRQAWERWKPKKALDEAVGADTPKDVKHRAAIIVRSTQFHMQIAKTISPRPDAAKIHVQVGLEKLCNLLPNADPAKLAKLFNKKLSDLYEE